MKAPAILIPKEPLPDLSVPPAPPRELHAESYQKGFRDGFQDGFAAADLSTPGVVLCGSGLLALLIACIVVMRHASRVVNILCQRFQVDVSKKSASQKLAGLVLPLLLCAGLTGCHQTGRSGQSRARTAGCRQRPGSRRQCRQGNGEVCTP